jgi:FkbM family methyltransferase
MTKGQSLLSVLLCLTPLQYLPVRVRRGLATGARWTLLPFSGLWRYGGEQDIVAAVSMLGDIKGASCWDLGAHVGIHTVGLAMQVGPEGQVAAFEPDPVSFRRLTRHVRMNRLSNVRLFNAAVSDQASRADLIVVDGTGSMTSHLPCDEESVGVNTPRITVETVRADALVERGELLRPDFIKVDVQGHGARALAGARVSIEKKRPLILFSNHSKGEADGTRRLLQPLGYEPFDVEGKRISWDAFQDLGHNSAILKAVPV